MAQESDSSGNVKSAEVDIDDIELDILVLAKTPQALKATSIFLARRGWSTTVMGNVSKAIEYIAEHRPDFVLISFNHASPAVARLPDLISQTFNLTCVGFMEQSDALSTQKLTQIKLRYKVFGQPSGPNFQRTIRRILGEKLNIKLDEEPAANAPQGNNVTIRGAKGAAGTGGDLIEIADKAKASNTIITKGAQHDGSTTVVGTNTTPVGSGASLHMPEHSTSAGGNSPAYTPMAGTGGDGTISSGAASKNHNSVQSSSAPEIKGDGKQAGRARKRLKDITGAEQAKSTAGNLLVGQDVGPQKASDSAADIIGRLKKSLFSDSGGIDPTDSAQASEASPAADLSAMEKAAEAGLKKICVPGPMPGPPLQMVSRAGVFPVDSATTPGYLVMAVERPLADEQKIFLKSCETALLAMFNTLAVQGKVESGFWLDLPQTPFEPWAEASGSFTFKVDHQGTQIGVAFFPTFKPLVKARPAGEQGMYAIAVEDISTETAVNFKAYLRLEKNKKFYLYLRNGRRLQSEQKQRLQQHKVNDIFMKSLDLENLRVYLANTFLISTISPEDEAA
jgi:hypothetical protein